MGRTHHVRPSSVRIAATRWWCCRSSCATARFGRRRHHDHARTPPINSTLDMAPGGLLRVSPGQRLRRLGQELLPHRSGTQMGACGHRCSVDAQLQAANSRPARRAIAIATAFDSYRSGRRGFLPRGLCNTCPTAVRVLDRLCGWAGVTQALTSADFDLFETGTSVAEDVSSM